MSELFQLLRRKSSENPIEAGRWLDLATGAFTRRPELAILRASTALRANEPTLAVARFLAAIQRFPGHKQLTQGLARALELADLPDAALESWIQLATNDPRHPSALRRAWALLDRLELSELPSCKPLAQAKLPHLRLTDRRALHRALRILGDEPGIIGAAWLEGALLKGWALDRVFPARKLELAIYIDGELGTRLAAEQRFPVGRGFSYTLPNLAQDRGFIIDILAQDGTRLSGAPIRYRPAPPPPKCLPPGQWAGHRMKGVDVVIPVYRERTLAARCFDALLASRIDNRTPFRLVVVNDCSPEPDIHPWLRAVARDAGGIYLQTSRNLGFIGAINFAMDICRDRDMVWLNSDTVVSGDWLDRLNAAAWSSPDVATVTPLSNNAQLFSHPKMMHDNPEPDARESAKLHRLAALANSGHYEQVPTGIGFCLYLKAEALRAAGPLDGHAYLLGYAEEIDYCFRLSTAGWRHLCATDVFVAHQGGASFQLSKARLSKDNDEIIQQRYPFLRDQISVFQRKDPLRKARARLERLWLAEHHQWDGLFLFSSTTASRYITYDMLHERWLNGSRDLQLRCVEDKHGLTIHLQGARETPPFNLSFRIPQESTELASALLALKITDSITVLHDRALPPVLMDLLGNKPETFDLICLDDSLERDTALRRRLPPNHIQHWHSRYRMARWLRGRNCRPPLRSLNAHGDSRWSPAPPRADQAWAAIWTQGLTASGQQRLLDLVRIDQTHVRWLLVGPLIDEAAFLSTGRCECLPSPNPATLLKHLAWIGCQCVLSPSDRPGPDPSAFLVSRRLVIPYVGIKAADGLAYLAEPMTHGVPARASPDDLLSVVLEALAERREHNA